LCLVFLCLLMLYAPVGSGRILLLGIMYREDWDGSRNHLPQGGQSLVVSADTLPFQYRVQTSCFCGVILASGEANYVCYAFEPCVMREPW
jgi:hypothetical protein